MISWVHFCIKSICKKHMASRIQFIFKKLLTMQNTLRLCTLRRNYLEKSSTLLVSLRKLIKASASVGSVFEPIKWHFGGLSAYNNCRTIVTRNKKIMLVILGTYVKNNAVGHSSLLCIKISTNQKEKQLRLL